MNNAGESPAAISARVVEVRFKRLITIRASAISTCKIDSEVLIDSYILRKDLIACTNALVKDSRAKALRVKTLTSPFFRCNLSI